jgi:Arc/MetJ family transcription regulator
MRTNIVLDDQLVNEAIKLSGIPTKREVVDAALREFVGQRKRRDMRDLIGKVRFYSGFDHKALREGKQK